MPLGSVLLLPFSKHVKLAPAADVLQFLVNGERKLISVCQLVEEEDAVTAAQF